MFLYTNLQTFCRFNKLKQPEYCQITYETHITFCYWTISGLFLHMNYISTELIKHLYSYGSAKLICLVLQLLPYLIFAYGYIIVPGLGSRFYSLGSGFVHSICKCPETSAISHIKLCHILFLLYITRHITDIRGRVELITPTTILHRTQIADTLTIKGIANGHSVFATVLVSPVGNYSFGNR